MSEGSLQDFQRQSSDWRGQLKRNQRRTVVVIGIFILLYLALGVLIDLFIYSREYYQVPLGTIFHALLTLKLTPYATLITSAVAVISLLITFSMYDKLMLLGSEYKEITPETAKTLPEQQFYNVLEEMKVASGLKYMPRAYIIDADYMNAFASGYSEKSAMVAITRGLLDKLDRAELQAVMAHEMSHIRHGDIKVTLMASVLSNLMLIVLDVLFYSVLFGGGRRDSNREGGGNWLFLVIMLLRFVLPLITVLLMLFLSRTREYMADAGCVELMRDNEPLARALLKIQGDHKLNADTYAQQYDSTPHEAVRREAYIFDPLKAGIGSSHSVSDFFSTHPNIKARLAAIGFKSRESE